MEKIDVCVLMDGFSNNLKSYVHSVKLIHLLIVLHVKQLKVDVQAAIPHKNVN